MLIHSAVITGSVQFNNTDVSGITSVASFASTGSNQFNGNQSISGSITSNGTITAQTLVVQTVTSSVEFITGSTRNGSLSSNTHQFTGSVDITGSLTVNNNLLVTGSVTAASAIARSTYINPTLVASANSDALIALDINPTFTNGAFTGVTNYALRTNGNLNIINGSLLIASKNVINISSSDILYGYSNWNTHQWYVLGTLKMALFSTGNLTLQNGGTFTDAGFKLDVSGSTRLNGNTTVTGSINVSGSITSNGTITAQTLVVQTVTSSIEFVTGSTRNGSIAENTHQFTGSVLMSGSLGIGTSSPSQKLHISDSTSVYCRIVNTAGADVYLGAESTQGVLSVNNNLPLDVRTNNITRLYINTSGSIGVGITPNTGWNSFTALQLGGSTYSALASSNHYLNIAANSYYDGTNFRYISTGFTSRYQLSDGTHLWYVANSGSAGNTISYTNVMTIANTGQVTLSNSPGIRFASGSSNLNYYTTSTWAPVFAAGGTTSFGLSSQTGTGRYTRIGNVVTIHGQISWSGAGTSGTNLNIQNLPFRVASDTRAGMGVGIVSGIGDLSAGGLQLVPELNSFTMYLITHPNDGSGHIHLIGSSVKNNGSRLFSFAGSYITDE
jgi:hypothetical protein